MLKIGMDVYVITHQPVEPYHQFSGRGNHYVTRVWAWLRHVILTSCFLVGMVQAKCPTGSGQGSKNPAQNRRKAVCGTLYTPENCGIGEIESTESENESTESESLTSVSVESDSGSVCIARG